MSVNDDRDSRRQMPMPCRRPRPNTREGSCSRKKRRPARAAGASSECPVLAPACRSGMAWSMRASTHEPSSSRSANIRSWPHVRARSPSNRASGSGSQAKHVRSASHREPRYCQRSFAENSHARGLEIAEWNTGFVGKTCRSVEFVSCRRMKTRLDRLTGRRVERSEMCRQFRAARKPMIDVPFNAMSISRRFPGSVYALASALCLRPCRDRMVDDRKRFFQLSPGQLEPWRTHASVAHADLFLYELYQLYKLWAPCRDAKAAKTTRKAREPFRLRHSSQS